MKEMENIFMFAEDNKKCHKYPLSESLDQLSEQRKIIVIYFLDQTQIQKYIKNLTFLTSFFPYLIAASFKN